ncbi:major vault protein-like isoform X2 [Centruroides sculpturatus]|uniref:major vault protein-like isoform X1 n=1 Tax=Centruroides sculpturatus TaxID=218467 RepID=UPI000C6D505B|nr:major vault protein-like isoform X1 [Centruroides sculpturatus]XP_023240230.1 major vault protein-like isoform X2 [Centruroides sculpturatus]
MTSQKHNRNEESIYRIPPYYYLHVLDQTSNVTRVEVGPQTYIRKENERVILGPEKMIIVPPGHYCVIQNPVIRDNDGIIQYDLYGQSKLRHADLEIRLQQDPFPLYPGEVLFQEVKQLQVVPANCALRVRALRDFEDGKIKRIAGDEWLFEGPGTYIPRKEVEVVEKVKATVIKPNQALKLRAKTEMIDRDGVKRVMGEEWLIKKIGAYLPRAHEEIVDVVNAYILTEKEAVHVRAINTFVDDLGNTRKNGEEWLVKMTDVDTYIPGVYEKVVGVIPITALSNRQYCVILDPVDESGKPQLSQKLLVKGDKSFFLHPGEHLEAGIQEIYVLSDNEGLVLRAKEAFLDTSVTPAVQRQPGDRWMINGAAEYIPPNEVEILAKRNAIPLDENEGIYVRNIKTGKVRAVCGETYMINQDEELWEKELSPNVESLLLAHYDPLADRGRWSDKHSAASASSRDKTRVITFRVPHNAAIQIYDYKGKKARVVFGPDLVMLGPDEQFTQLSLSGGKPKKPNVIRSLCLLLGPDFCTDVITVETADHARLQLQLAYNWHFDVSQKDEATASKLFAVPDFIGDLCKAVASRIRGAVASTNFDDFHKNSATIIRAAVFGYDSDRKIRNRLIFPQNNLVITSVDIQSVEPVDQRTRDSLQKSVQLAIEITTQSQEAAARHEAERREQEARGKLERQRISDEVESERSRKDLLELQAASMAVESCGQAKAEAKSKAEAQRIEAETAVEQAKLKVDAMTIEAEAELERLMKAREAEISYLREQDELQIKKSKELAEIDVQKFKDIISALGPDTIRAIALAGPELQVKILQGLGLHTTLITDGNCPINLFNTAQGLIGNSLLEPPAKMQKVE